MHLFSEYGHEMQLLSMMQMCSNDTSKWPEGTRHSTCQGPHSPSVWVKHLVECTMSLVWSTLGISFIWKPATGTMCLSQARSRHGQTQNTPLDLQAQRCSKAPDQPTRERDWGT